MRRARLPTGAWATISEVRRANTKPRVRAQAYALDPSLARDGLLLLANYQWLVSFRPACVRYGGTFGVWCHQGSNVGSGNDHRRVMWEERDI